MPVHASIVASLSVLPGCGRFAASLDKKPLGSCRVLPPRIVNQKRWTAGMAAAKDVWALDFDGVVADSVGESSLSAWMAAETYWPEMFADPVVQSRKEEVLEQMRVVRPVVETGYENIVQIRALLEGEPADNILKNWHELLPHYMQKLGLDRATMVQHFGSTRDEWMKRDMTGWLSSNGIYEGVPPILKKLMTEAEVYIVTTKQARFTEALLRDLAGIDVPPDRIFSQTESGRPKYEVLARLEATHPASPRLVFVEDKLATLEKVALRPDCEKWQLYLVDWGYNTPEERARAAANPRIQVIDIARFASL